MFSTISRKPFKAAENDFIASQFPVGGIWLGINDNDTEGTWVAEDGSALNYFNWHSGEPNGGGNENAAHIFEPRIRIDGDATWNDSGESALNNVLCIFKNG